MRTRILIGTIVLTALTIAAFFVPAAISLSNAEGEAQVVELQREAADAAAQLNPHLDDGDGDGGATDAWVGERTANAGASHAFAVYDGTGRRLSGSGPAQADAPVRSALAGMSATARVDAERVVAVPLAGGGALRAAEPTSEADDRTRAAVIRLGLIAVLVLVVAALGAWLLAQRLTEPLRALRRSAARLGGGDFTATAPVTGVSEIDDVADALNASATRIGRLVERERRLTADTSHQLRTPIAGLRLALESEAVSPREDPSQLIEEALGAVDRLEVTVAALADLARDELSDDPFDIDDVVSAAMRTWLPVLRRAGREIEVGPPCDERSPTHAIAVGTILDVLLENALHHGTGTVRLDVDCTSGTAQITVTDQGHCDLDEERLFERHESGAGGTGIGLHLARTLAEAEGARLRLVRRDSTQFQLQLPLLVSS